MHPSQLVRGLIPLAAVSFLVAAACSSGADPAAGPTQRPDYRQLLPRDAIHPVYSPKFLPAVDAPLRPDELVIGVEIRGEARAYPIQVLSFREIVDDKIGPVPFLVTW